MQKYVTLDQIKDDLNQTSLSKFLINLTNTNQIKDVFSLLEPLELKNLDLNLRFLKLRLYILNTKFPEVIDAIDTHLSETENTISIDEKSYFLSIRGRTLLDLNRHDEARAALEAADLLLPDELIENSIGTSNYTTYATRKAGIKVFWGISNVYKGQLDEAMEYLHDAISLYDSVGNEIENAGAKMVMGIIYIEKIKFDKAKEILLNCLNIFENANDLIQQAHTLLNLSIIHFRTKQLDHEENYLLRAKSLYEKTGFTRGVLNTLENLAQTYTLRGSYRKALDISNDMVKLSKNTNIIINLGNTYTNIALNQRRLGNIDEAEKNLLLALDANKKAGYNSQYISILIDLGKHSLDLGRYTEAEEYYEEGLKKAKEHSFDRLEGVGLTYLGLLHLMKGDMSKAEKYLVNSHEIKKKEGDPESIATTLRYLGYLHYNKNDLENAERYYHESYELLKSLDNEYDIAEAITNLVWIAFGKQDYELVQNYINEFEKLIPTAEGPTVKEIYDLIICNQKIALNKFDNSTESTLMNLYEKSSLEYTFRIKSIFLLMEIKIKRFEKEKSIDILNELSFWKDELKLLANEQNLIKLNIDSLIFESKIELAKCEISRSHQILDEALNLIEGKELNFLYNEIQEMRQEIDDLKTKICETNINSYSVEELLVIMKITDFVKEKGSWGAFPQFKL